MMREAGFRMPRQVSVLRGKVYMDDKQLDRLNAPNVEPEATVDLFCHLVNSRYCGVLCCTITLHDMTQLNGKHSFRCKRSRSLPHGKTVECEIASLWEVKQKVRSAFCRYIKSLGG